MTHEFQIDSNAGLLREVFTGSVSLDSLTRANAAILAHPNFKVGLKFLTDLRNAEITFGHKEMQYHIASLPLLHVARHAFVVSKDREYGMIRMFLSLTGTDDIFGEANIFKSIEEGLKWLTS